MSPAEAPAPGIADPAAIPAIVEEVRTGRLSARRRAAAALAAAVDLGGSYGAFITLTETAALDAGRAVDAAAENGRPVGPLAGVTVAVKDLLATRDAPTTAQSLVHDPAWFGGRDATVVGRLRAAGACVLGKTSMAEHAMGRIDPARPFPVPRNPWDPGRWPGGSSSGSAIAVALDIADAALGTDTTGSLRIPAAFCGITSLRPTAGLVPIDGCMPASPTLDVIGPLARSARDCAAVLAVIAPQTAHGDGSPSATWRDRLDGVTVGVPSERLAEWSERIDPSIRALFDAALEDLAALGAEIVPFEWPEAAVLQAATASIALAEVFAGHVDDLRTRWNDLGRSFRRLAVLGALTSRDDIASARSALGPATEALLARMSASGVDVIATPTWAQPAPQYAVGVDTAAEDLNLTAVWSATGQPVAATPMGFDALGLPASLQLTGRPGEDLHVLEIADAYERATRWGRCRPHATLAGFPAVPDPDEGAPAPSSRQRAAVDAVLGPLGITAEDSDIVPIARGLAAIATAADRARPADTRENDS